MATIPELTMENRSNIFKAMMQGVFVRPRLADQDVVPVETVVSTGTDGRQTLTLPPGFHAVGLLRKGEGVEFTRDISTADVESENYRQPTRRDPDSDVRGVTFTAQETARRAVIALAENLPADFEAVETDHGWTVVHGESVQVVHWEALVIGQDGARGSERWLWSYFADVTLSGGGGMKFGMGEESVRTVELTAFPDPILGGVKRDGYEGPGFTTVVRDRLGFPVGGDLGTRFDPVTPTTAPEPDEPQDETGM